MTEFASSLVLIDFWNWTSRRTIYRIFTLLVFCWSGKLAPERVDYDYRKPLKKCKTLQPPKKSFLRATFFSNFIESRLPFREEPSASGTCVFTIQSECNRARSECQVSAKIVDWEWNQPIWLLVIHLGIFIHRWSFHPPITRSPPLSLPLSLFTVSMRGRAGWWALRTFACTFPTKNPISSKFSQNLGTKNNYVKNTLITNLPRI